MKPKIAIVVASMVLAAPTYAQTKTIPHYRKSGGYTYVCQEIWGANYNPCDQVPLALVKKIDELAKDECENDPTGGIPHATSGDAIVLNYQCQGGHMKRDPYVWHFDADGYRPDVWKVVTR
jgi:hypothetical protein